MIKLQLRWRNKSKLKELSMLCSWTMTSLSDKPLKIQKSYGGPRRWSTSRLAGKTSSSSARFAKASSIRSQMWLTTCGSTRVPNPLSARSVEWLFHSRGTATDIDLKWSVKVTEANMQESTNEIISVEIVLLQIAVGILVTWIFRDQI